MRFVDRLRDFLSEPCPAHLDETGWVLRPAPAQPVERQEPPEERAFKTLKESES